MFSSPLFWIITLAGMNFIWAGSYSAMKFGLDSLKPVQLVFFRFFSAFIIAVIIVFLRRMPVKFSRNDLLRITTTGILVGISHIISMTGIGMSQASNAALLYSFEPIWGIFLAAIFLKERLHLSTFAGLALVLAGFLWLSGFDISAFAFADKKAGFGNLLFIIGLFCEGFFSVLLQPVAKKHDPLLIIAGVLFISLLILFPVMAVKGFSISISAGDVFVVGYLSVLCTVIGFTLWVHVMKHVPVSIMLFTIFIQPLAGPFIASIFLGEPMDERLLVGGSLLISGMAAAVFGHFFYEKRIERLLS